MLLKNHTGETSRIGYTVIADPKNPSAFVYAGANATNIIGIITQAVPRYAQCEIATTGVTKVFVFERVVKGSLIRSQRASDNISRGTCKAAKSSDRPYFQIGTALESGKGLISVALNLSSGEAAENYVPYSGATQDVDLGSNGLEANDIAIGGTANYVSIDGSGNMTFNGDATVWDDLRILPSQFDRPGTTDPTIQDWQPGGSGTTFKVWCFNQSQMGYFTVQMPHGYKHGSSIYAHAHWTPHTRGNEESGKIVAWKLDYSWANINGTFGASANVDMTDTCDGTDHKHQMTPEVVISGANKTVSSMLVCRIYRDSTDNWVGTGASGPALLELDFHFELDTVGSKLQSSK